MAWDVWKGYDDVTATFLGLSTDAEHSLMRTLLCYNASQSCFMTVQAA